MDLLTSSSGKFSKPTWADIAKEQFFYFFFLSLLILSYLGGHTSLPWETERASGSHLRGQRQERKLPKQAEVQQSRGLNPAPQQRQDQHTLKTDTKFDLLKCNSKTDKEIK